MMMGHGPVDDPRSSDFSKARGALEPSCQGVEPTTTTTTTTEKTAWFSRVLPMDDILDTELLFLVVLKRFYSDYKWNMLSVWTLGLS